MNPLIRRFQVRMRWIIQRRIAAMQGLEWYVILRNYCCLTGVTCTADALNVA
jgi:hypothetical protein